MSNLLYVQEVSSKSDLLSKTWQDFSDHMQYLIYLSVEILLPVGLHVLLDGGKLLEPVAVRFQVWELLYSNLDKNRDRETHTWEGKCKKKYDFK